MINDDNEHKKDTKRGAFVMNSANTEKLVSQNIRNQLSLHFFECKCTDHHNG